MKPFAGKPRIAFFDFACCEGCQLTVLELEEKLLELLAHVQVVAWREAMSETGNEYDIAFCEGAITRQRDVERIQAIRDTAGILVALGTCACIGCHNSLKDRWPVQELVELVYGKAGCHIDTGPSRPVAEVVKVDYRIHGCPVSLPEFESVFKRILTGQSYSPPNQPVCVECKQNDTLCVYEKGMICLGPVTRCGCHAICTAFGDVCQGCRGLIDQANIEGFIRVLSREKLHPIMAGAARKNPVSREDIMARIRMYNSMPASSAGEGTTDGRG